MPPLLLGELRRFLRSILGKSALTVSMSFYLVNIKFFEWSLFLVDVGEFSTNIDCISDGRSLSAVLVISPDLP